MMALNTVNGQSSDFTPDYSKCVRIFNGGIQSNGQSVLRFYNGCPQRLNFNACVMDTTGAVKLYTSPRTVPTNGNWTIYTFPNVDPAHVDWIASPGTPPTPNLCRK